VTLRYEPTTLLEYTNLSFKPNNVLNLHHERNGRPRLPDPALLDLLRAAEIDTSNSKVKWKRKHKWKSKSKQKSRVVDGSESDSEGPKATQLGWYSSR
jgi:hypothetical protein